MTPPPGALARLLPFAALLAIGAAWGATTPLVKTAVAEGWRPFGILLWQMSISAGLLALILRLRGGTVLPRTPEALRLYLAVASLGMVVPHFFSYTAVAHLPAGVMSIIISMVPLFALPLALVLGMERFRPLRLLGLGLGAGAIVLLMAPQSSLPAGAATVFVLVAMLTPLCYALEGAYVAGRGTRAVGPLQTLLGGSLMGLAAVVPLALVTGQAVSPLRAWGAADLAIAATGVLGTFAYAGYVALIRATGPVFAAQVSYLVTGTGILWAMLLLGERYSGWVWGALALLFAGLFLVQPRPVLPPPAAPAPEPDTTPARGLGA